MNVLITGGAGYIGTELIASLAKDSSVKKIVVYDNLSRANYNLFIGRDKFREGKVHFEQGDILDSRRLKKVLKGVDVVYHLAAKVTTPFADQNPHLFEQVNHWGTAELVYAAETCDISRFIYLSSVSVYGAGQHVEDVKTTLNPRTFYGISKMGGEQHVERLMGKFPTYIIRCGNVFGYSKSMRFDAVINRFMFDANFKRRIQIHGDGTQSRAFIHIKDVTSLLSKIPATDLQPGTYNLVKRNISINELVEQMESVFPDLELLFMNQHMKLRSITVSNDKRIDKLLENDNLTFVEELREFRKAFTFS